MPNWEDAPVEETPVDPVEVPPETALILRPPEQTALDSAQRALVPVQQQPLTLFGALPPLEMRKAASEVAGVLAEIIDKRKLYKTIKGKRHVYCEGWTTLAAMLGYLPFEVSNEDRPDGRYISTTELRRLTDGFAIARATAECGGPDESLWQDREPYARRSMATTRSAGKVCRIALSWVMQLAGFEVTPAEEMMRLGDNGADDDTTPPLDAALRAQRYIDMLDAAQDEASLRAVWNDFCRDKAGDAALAELSGEVSAAKDRAKGRLGL